nr:hypothetical protein Iba_chr13dCG4430 [Ipomoea batatas]
MDVLMDDHVTREVNAQEHQEGRMGMDENQNGTNVVDINVEAENEEYEVENVQEIEVEVNQREIDVQNDDGNNFEVEANLDTNIGGNEESDNFVANLDATNDYVEANTRVDAQGEINEIFGVEAELDQEGVEIDPSIGVGLELLQPSAREKKI